MTSTDNKILENGYYRVEYGSQGIVSLQMDPRGGGQFKCSYVAHGKGLTGFAKVELDGAKLIFTPGAEEFSWPLPFVRKGYYDADQHLNYPEATTIQGAEPLVLPVRKFVTSNGQTLLIEYFKRLALGEHGLWFNMNNGERLWMFGDEKAALNLELYCPNRQAVYYEVGEDFLRLHCPAQGKPPIVFELLPSADQAVSRFPFIHPALKFEPDFDVRYDFSGKNIGANSLSSDFLQMGIFWRPTTILNGEWILDAVRTHCFDDTRTRYDEVIREGLFRNLALMGYDRFEHFGMIFNWGTYPDYGAGGLLNLPPGNAPYDMRMLQVNAMYIIAVAEYVMATGDESLLKARAARWLETDGEEAQPLCGGNATYQHCVLAAGDARLDGKVPLKTFSLGQTFTANKPFARVALRLGVLNDRPSTATAVAHIELYQLGQKRQLLKEQSIELDKTKPDQKVQIALEKPLSEGKYEVRVSDERSGRSYFGPTIVWWSDPEANYDGGQAFFGPFAGSIRDQMKVVFDYIYQCTGPERENLSYYMDDRQFNVPDQKSGRNQVSMQNSYHECLGGGYDAFLGMWYPPACRAMAQIERMAGEEENAQSYLDLERKAADAYNKKYWHEVTENGRVFQRYYGSQDWDGKIHDYGFTYINLEAADLGISSPEQARRIVWWLDRGQWKSADDEPWRDDIYSLWQISAPYNTIENSTWIGITGWLPYLQVLTNGGTRLMYGARDLTVRARCLSVDNMHERNKQVLGRFASPDRLTGGRTLEEPGGRGRWHFGPPMVEKADIEGFREIFPGNGAICSAQIAAYLGTQFSAQGLLLHPQVPSELEAVSLHGVGYQGGVLNFDVHANRQNIQMAQASKDMQGLVCTFRAARPFNKVGVKAVIRSSQSQPQSLEGRVAVTLEKKVGQDWRSIAWNWMNHVRDEQQIWVTAQQTLDPSQDYRLRIHDVISQPGTTVSFDVAQAEHLMPRLVLERTHVTALLAREAREKRFVVQKASGVDSNKIDASGCKIVLEPGEHVLLTRAGKWDITDFQRGRKGPEKGGRKKTSLIFNERKSEKAIPSD